MERSAAVVMEEDDLNLKATELRLGLPGTESAPAKGNKRSYGKSENEESGAPTMKAQVIGWPPVRCFRKNVIRMPETDGGSSMFVKVSMDGAPYLRKIDLKFYNSYADLVKALEIMFQCTIGVYSEREGYKASEYAPTYEDKDGDWMLVGDVPWEMFYTSCKRLRIMKGSDAKGLGCCL